MLPTAMLLPSRFMLFRFFVVALVSLFAFSLIYTPMVRAQTPPASEPAADDEILFISQIDGRWHAYVINSDGSDKKLVTKQINFPRSLIDVYSAVFSPDRSQIALAVIKTDATTYESEHRLYLVNADGKGLKLLWRGDTYALDPVWSPKGDQIAFFAYSEGSYFSQAYLINTDGSSLTMLDLGEAAYSYSLDWSPDGEQIATGSSFRIGEAFTGALLIVNADGSDLRRPVEGAGNIKWSPDGQQILFVSGYGDASQMSTLSMDGITGVQPLTQPGPVFYPAWSPDGTRIAFVTSEGGQENLFVMKPDGSEVMSLTQVEDKHFLCVQWLPDGEQIATMMAPKGWTFHRPEIDLYVVEADGSGGMTALTDSSTMDMLPNCTPLFG